MYRVLCILDASSQDEAMAQGLQQKGLLVAKSYDFHEAYPIMNEFYPDVIIANVKSLCLPDGTAFITRLRKDDKFSFTPLIGIFESDIPSDLGTYSFLSCEGFCARKHGINAIYYTVKSNLENFLGKNRRILLMEDDQAINALVKEVLIPQNINLVEVSNGFDAMGAIKNLYFDMIITDIRVKGFNGFQLIDYIRNKGRHTPILVITGVPPDEFEEQASKVEGLTYLQKPFKIEVLLEKVLYVLNRKQGNFHHT